MEVTTVTAVTPLGGRQLLKIFYKIIVTFCFEVVIFKMELVKGVTCNLVTLYILVTCYIYITYIIYIYI